MRDCVFMPAHLYMDGMVVLNVSIQRFNSCPCITLQKERQREKEEGEKKTEDRKEAETEGKG